MIHYLIIKTKVRNKFKLLVKLYKNNINIYDIYEQNNYLYLKINYDDYAKLQKTIVTFKFEMVDEGGIYHLKRVLSPLKVIIIILFIGFVFIFSNIILSVDVIHSDKEIRTLVTNELEEYGIVKGSIKKNFKDLEEIKEKILENNKEKLEWLEIEQVGMKYIVRIQERIINKEESQKNYCHITASKSGIISKIMAKKGVVSVSDGTYVNEGDILISGEIKLNDEVKENVCASGTVLAEVWYTTSVSLPIKYQQNNKTGKMRYNFLIETPKKKYKIFKSRLENYETKEKKIFKIFNLTFYLLEEYEVTLEVGEYSIDEALNKSINLADDKINAFLNDNEEIKLRKVLKKSLNNSKMDVEIFYVVIEDISKQIEYTIEEEVS